MANSLPNVILFFCAGECQKVVSKGEEVARARIIIGRKGKRINIIERFRGAENKVTRMMIRVSCMYVCVRLCKISLSLSLGAHPVVGVTATHARQHRNKLGGPRYRYHTASSFRPLLSFSVTRLPHAKSGTSFGEYSEIKRERERRHVFSLDNENRHRTRPQL